MNISAMLDVANNKWDQLNRDGFQFTSTDGLNLESSAYDHANYHWTQP